MTWGNTNIWYGVKCDESKVMIINRQEDSNEENVKINEEKLKIVTVTVSKFVT